MLTSSGSLDNFLNCINPIAEAQNITGQITLNELYETLCTCDDSAPGPDGIPYSVIKLSWSYFGPCLLNSWNYAKTTGALASSHETSYLRLLPKEGKDITLLKNWRPITLSNCDFKIITKTLAKKLTNAVSKSLISTQTAYIAGRQITDNLHTILHAIESSNKLNRDIAIMSLDAEKAFDSIEHWYLKKLLKKMGLNNFIPNFELIYANQEVNILLNGNNSGKYIIKNGVKQGDALSCILFIMGVEPLLRNIENDPTIKNIDYLIPKTIAYADDIACIVTPDEINIKKVFKHYEDLTNISGLKLNADKTEILQKNLTMRYDISYNGGHVCIKPVKEIKLNGIYLSFDEVEMSTKNYATLYQKVFNQLANWSHRYLSIMGKILIYKTYGLSQLLYAGSVIKFTKTQEKNLDELIYRFIWSKSMMGNKAPDRIKRKILANSVNNLGFGMVDFRHIIQSIRLKSVIRLMYASTHPMGEILKVNTNKSIIAPRLLKPIRSGLDESINELRDRWMKLLKDPDKNSISDVVELLGNEYLGNLVLNRFKNRIIVKSLFNVKLKSIERNKWLLVLKYLDKNMSKLLTDKYPLNNDNTTPQLKLPVGNKTLPINKITSKILRSTLTKPWLDPPKMLSGLENLNIKSIARNIKALSNVKNKTIALRLIHGDIYCGTRLKKFGMSDNEMCPRCNEEETILHQILTCPYTAKIWDHVSSITGTDNKDLASIMGMNQNHSKATFSLNIEIIKQLLAIERPITDPKILVERTITRLTYLERGITKMEMNQLLCELTRQT